MTDPLAALARNKLVCTGVTLDCETPAAPVPGPATEAAFDVLVTEYYKLFRETLRSDVAFLRSVESPKAVVAFDGMISKLRHAKQHNDEAAKKFYISWIAARPWEVVAKSLWDALVSALSELVRVSSRVRRDPKLKRAWQDSVATDTESIFEAVSQDLCVSFRGGFRKKLLHNINLKRQRLGPQADVRAEVVQFCVQEIVAAQSPALPVPHDQILDRLGLLGHRDACAALLVAHSLSAATKLRGVDFLERIEEMWRLGTS
ncbi:hypothetical protein ABZ737_07965 [Streptomyces sp. NPDC013087]|uniref:hypothetical protein n=1 Tax=Streptomyces sp. NPDC013087 TaxID=3156694 RepID=UPI003407981D